METENKTQGWVYVLTNPDIIGKVKIGHTTRSVEERIKELSAASGVPHPFVLFHTQPFQNSEKTEKLIHAFLSPYRDKKEFFTIAPERAMQVVDNFFYQEKFAQYDQRIQKLEKQNQEKEAKIMGLRTQISEQNENIENLQTQISVNESIIDTLMGKFKLVDGLSENEKDQNWITVLEEVNNVLSQIDIFDKVSLHTITCLSLVQNKLVTYYGHEEERIEEEIEELKAELKPAESRIAFYQASEEERELMNMWDSYSQLFSNKEEPINEEEFVNTTIYCQKLKAKIENLANELQTITEKIAELEKEMENLEKWKGFDLSIV